MWVVVDGCYDMVVTDFFYDMIVTSLFMAWHVCETNIPIVVDEDSCFESSTGIVGYMCLPCLVFHTILISIV